MFIKLAVVVLFLAGYAALMLYVLPEIARRYSAWRAYARQQVRAAEEAAKEETEV